MRLVAIHGSETLGLDIVSASQQSQMGMVRKSGTPESETCWGAENRNDPCDNRRVTRDRSLVTS